MKYFKYLLALSILVPSLAYGAIVAPWNATSTDKGSIQPTTINGNNPSINIAGFNSYASSTVPANLLQITGLSTGCVQITANLLTSTGSACGTITAVSVATANGFAGSSSGGATPQLTLTTTITSNVLKGNGTAISGAVNGTDYTLITAQDCTGIGHLLKVTATGVFTCSADTGGGGAGTGTVSTTTPLVSGQVDFSTGVSTIGNDATFLFDTTFKRLTAQNASTTVLTVSGASYIPQLANLTSNGLVYTAGSNGTLNTVATSTLTGTGLISVTGGAYTLGSTPIVVSCSTCGAGTVTSVTGTWPVLSSGGATPIISWDGLSTSSPISASQLLYATGVKTIASVATSTLTPSSPLTGSFIQIGSGGSLGCTTAASGIAGCLSNTSFDTFNNKQATIGVTWPITLSGATVGFNGLSTTTALTTGRVPYVSGVNTFADEATSSIASGVGITVTNGSTAYVLGAQPSIACNTANTSTFGCLTAADWNTFNNKDKNEKFATSTDGYVIYPTGQMVSIGTTTSRLFPLTISSSTLPQLSLGDGAGNPQWTFRAAGGNFYITTTTVQGLSTSTLPAVTWLSNGFEGLGSSSPGSLLSIGSVGGINIGTATSTWGSASNGINITNGCFAIAGVCLSTSSGGGSGTVTDLLQSTGFLNNGTHLTTTGTMIVGIATSATPSLSGLAYWTGIGTAALPSFLGTAATTTLAGGGPITVSNSPVVLGASGAVLGCTSASTSVTGCLTSTDWNTFNNKSNSKWATSTDTYGIYPSLAGLVSIGTTTSRIFPLTVASSTVPQLALGSGVAGEGQITFRVTGGFMYGATTTGQGTATSSLPFEVWNPNGYLGIGGTTTPGSLFSINNVVNFDPATTSFSSIGGINLKSGCFAIAGVCLSTTGVGGSGTVTSITNGTGLVNQGTSYTTTGTITSAFASGTTPTIGRLAMFSSTGSGSTSIIITDTATSSLTATSPLALSQPISVLGSSASALTCAQSTTIAIGCIFSNEKFATSTDGYTIYPTGQMMVLGTTTSRIFPSTIASSTVPQLALGDGVAGDTQWTFRNAGKSLFLSTTTAQGLATSTISQFSIDGSSGAVGINDDTSDFKLEVVGVSANGGFGVSTVGNDGDLLNVLSNGTTNAGTTTSTGVAQVGIFTSSTQQLSLSNGTGVNQVTFRNAGGNLYIATTTVQGSATTTTPAVEIDSTGGGAVGVGTSTPTAQLAINAINTTDYANIAMIGTSTSAGATKTVFRIDNNGNIFAPATQIQSGAATDYWCYDTNSQFIRVSAICTTSALKFKERITPLKQGLDTVLAMTPVNYYLNQLGHGDNPSLDQLKQQIGFIADYEATTTPLLIIHDGNGDIHGFNYEQYTAILTKAIQELDWKEKVQNYWQWFLMFMMLCWIIRLEIKTRK